MNDDQLIIALIPSMFMASAKKKTQNLQLYLGLLNGRKKLKKCKSAATLDIVFSKFSTYG